MRNIIIVLTLLLLLVPTIGCAQKKIDAKVDAKTGELNWLEDYDLALQTASNEEKIVLINFTGSDWCGWCKKLVAEVFSKPEFANYANKNLVLLMLDFPSNFKELPANVQKERQQLQEKYKVRGYPTILLTNAQGEVIAQTGYQAGGAEKYVEHLAELINKK